MLALGMGLAGVAWSAQGAEYASPPPVAGDPALIEKVAEAGPTVSADISLQSAYVSRGEVNSDRPVLQPQFDVSKFGFTVGVWANDELTEHAYGQRGFSEIDLMLNYQLPVKPVNVFVGVIEYSYLYSCSETLPDGTRFQTSVPSTREVFVSATWDNPWLTPRAEIYYDFGQADGFYVDAILEHEFDLAPGWTLTPGASSGWGSREFNEYTYGAEVNAFLDGNLYAQVDYAWKNGVKLGGNLEYTWLWDEDVRSSAEQVYLGTKQLYGGVTLTYEF